MVSKPSHPVNLQRIATDPWISDFASFVGLFDEISRMTHCPVRAPWETMGDTLSLHQRELLG